MEFSTPQTAPSVSDLDRATRARKITARLDDLRAHGRHDYTLTVTGTNYVTIIDALTKDQTK
ncbi:hypothetical protein [Cryobacterium sp. M91]|uniref:hypothetical protein n=1 Tax=Cryobacterium sp. M91 TaxID=2048294 RepID=UPI000CE2B6CF|nr:hypothetical protein [Cryobacterium sp. M91]